MSDTPQIFPLSDQPSFIQLLVSAIVILLAGMIFTLFFFFAGALLFNSNPDKLLMVAQGKGAADTGMIFKYLQATQGMSIFILPSVIISFMMTNGRGDYLHIKNKPAGLKILFVICLAVFLIPVTGAAGIFNSKLNLPGWLGGLEKWILAKEETASYLTGILLQSNSFRGLLINIFVIAVLPAIGEELFFRGIIQQILIKMFRSGHLAIWITAIVFSSIHLQFFGFLPRLMLGLVFGYLFYWGGSIWLPVIAHFVNNAIPVISSYFTGINELNNRTLEFAETGIFSIFFSSLICLMILLYFRNTYKSGKPGRYHTG
jgi:uncharacterized protein